MLDIKTYFKCLYSAFNDTLDHDGVEHAGYLAFLSLLGAFPFLVFLFAIVGFIGKSELGLQLINIILDNDLLPNKVLDALTPRIDEISSGPPQGLLTFAICGAIWTASSTVDGLRTILNRAYRVSTPPAYIWRRLMSIFEFLVLTAIIIFGLFMLIIGPNLWEATKQSLHLYELQEYLDFSYFEGEHSWDFIRYGITYFILFFSICATYIILPNTKQTIKSIIPGAALVLFLWIIAASLFSTYLKNFDQVNIIYGSLGGIIAFLLFFYLTAMIFIFGAEYNYHLETAKGNRIIEKEKSQ